ncbi:MAG: hypothetical protein M3R38_02200 [Actinomycetota bacterium]|nr:hypothetical protein [Actinomycetota bacterium]
MPENEHTIFEEALENLREAAQRIRAVSHLMRSTGMTEDPNYHDLVHRVASALAMTEAAGMEARRKLGKSGDRS